MRNVKLLVHGDDYLGVGSRESLGLATSTAGESVRNQDHKAWTPKADGRESPESGAKMHRPGLGG